MGLFAGPIPATVTAASGQDFGDSGDTSGDSGPACQQLGWGPGWLKKVEGGHPVVPYEGRVLVV